MTGKGIASLLIGIMASVSEWERERFRERTADQKRLAKQQRRYLGGQVPWEKKIVRGTLVDDERTISLVKKLRTWRRNGVALRDCQQKVKELGFAVSIATVQRLGDEGLRVGMRSQKRAGDANQVVGMSAS